MNINLSLSYVNIILFIIFVIFLGQPEHVVLIHVCLAVSGSIVANRFYTEELIEYKKFILYDLYLHWVPALLTLSMTDFAKVGGRQFLFAALYPLMYLSIQSYKHEGGWTVFKFVNPKDHVENMYPGVPLSVYVGYFVVLLSIYLSRSQLGLNQ